MRIVFVTDGGKKHGMGHIYETVTLAQELKNRAEILFLTRSGNDVIEKIRGSKFEVMKAQDSNQLIEQLQYLQPDVVVIDIPILEEHLIKLIKNNLKPSANLVAFGNTRTNLPINIGNFCDVVIDLNLGSGNPESESFYDENQDTLYLRGPRYVILRNEFFHYRKRYRISNKLKRILLLFGGSDPQNLTTKVLTKLLSLRNSFSISVILGPSFVHIRDLTQLLQQHHGCNIKIYKNTENVAELMFHSDIVCTSPGISMFEALCIGVPVIAIYQNDLQRKAFGDFEFVYGMECIQDLEKIIFTTFNWFKIKGKIKIDIGSGKAEIIDALLRKGGKRD